MKSSLNSRPRIRRLIAFTAGGALLAGSVSASAFAVPSETDATVASQKGTLIIDKAVVNPDGAPIEGLKFVMNWVCKGGGEDEDHSSADKSSGGGGQGGGGQGGGGQGGGEGGGENSGQVTVVVGQPASIENIPGKKTCTVTEEAPKDIDGFTWGEPSFEPVSVNIFKDNQTIKVTNTITRDRGDLQITKALAQGSTAYDGEFTIGYSCEPSGEAPGGLVEGTVTIPAGESDTVKVPTGYTCVVTETAFPSVPGFAWSTPLIVGSPTAEISGEEGGTREVTVANLLTATPPPPPAPAPEPAPAVAAATPPPAGAAPEATPVVPETPVTPAPGTGVAPTTPVTSVEPAAATGVPTSVNAGEGPVPSKGTSVAMWLLMIAAISAAVTWGLTRWTNAEGETHMQKVHME